MDNRKLSPKAARVNAGLQQIEAAERLGVTSVTLRNWERGATLPKINMAQKMADLYRVKLEEIAFCEAD